MGRIILDGMEFFAYHGCFKEEQLIGTKFIVDMAVETDTSAAEQSDHLHDTVNYAGLYNAVKAEMEVKSHLLEHLASRIVKSVADLFPSITAIELKVSKLNPPIGGKMGQVSFETFWNRN
ncbi:MAG: dihydroneopterin aldolase [Bacteroidetes bacterium]|nr:MAG: dihydroneopterin aldolase [Bacteroidota bacterium]